MRIGVHIIFPLTLFTYLHGMRDPFSRTDGCHSYAYCAFGTVHGTSQRFGLLNIDGMYYQVKEGDCTAGHEIVTVMENEMSIKDSCAKEIKIPLQKKPFNLDKLKG